MLLLWFILMSLSLSVLFVFDVLFILFRITWWPSGGYLLGKSCPVCYRLYCFTWCRLNCLYSFPVWCLGQDVAFACIGSWSLLFHLLFPIYTESFCCCFCIPSLFLVMFCFAVAAVDWLVIIWAASWENQQMTVHPAKTQISLGIRTIWSRVFTVRSMVS